MLNFIEKKTDNLKAVFMVMIHSFTWLYCNKSILQNTHIKDSINKVQTSSVWIYRSDLWAL